MRAFDASLSEGIRDAGEEPATVAADEEGGALLKPPFVEPGVVENLTRRGLDIVIEQANLLDVTYVLRLEPNRQRAVAGGLVDDAHPQTSPSRQPSPSGCIVVGV